MNTMKSNIDSQISARIQSFTRELQDLVRQQALEAVRTVLGAAGTSSGHAPAPAQRTSKPPVRAAKKTGKRRGRAPADLSAITEPIVSMLRATPGQRAEDLGQALGMKAKELKRPIDRLLADGAIRKEGKARATRYFAV